jgi:hypothetical protein
MAAAAAAAGGGPKPMEVLHRFGTLGHMQGQFNSPHGFCLGFDDDIVIADTNNHRIQVSVLEGWPWLLPMHAGVQ